MAPLPNDAPVGVYIHIPFCRHICPYCDFNTYRGLDALVPRYVDALVRDIAAHPRMAAQTIYLGGGTPVAAGPGADRAHPGRVPKQPSISTPTPKSRWKRIRTGVDAPGSRRCGTPGVNRLSIGAQTFDRKGLRVLGRQHEAADVIAAVERARGRRIRQSLARSHLRLAGTDARPMAAAIWKRSPRCPSSIARSIR